MKTGISKNGTYEIVPSDKLDGKIIIDKDTESNISICYKINYDDIGEILAKLYQGQERRFEIEMKNHFYREI